MDLLLAQTIRRYEVGKTHVVRQSYLESMRNGLVSSTYPTIGSYCILVIHNPLYHLVADFNGKNYLEA